MKFTIILISLLFIVASCGGGSTDTKLKPKDDKPMTEEDSLVAKKDSLNIKSEIDMSLVDPDKREEFLESLADIEDQYGQQWDFCTCVVKNDSIDKVFKNPGLSDSEVDRLMTRFDEIDLKCKAFLAQNPNQTPEDRIKHEKKVKDCLKAAGIK